MALEISNQYLYTGRGPFDAKALVKTYAELLSKETWSSENNKITAYNGMVVAVWLNQEDPSKNGVYYLYDNSVTSTFKAPDVTNATNWHKVAMLDDLTALTLKTEVTADKLAGIETTVTDYVASIVNSIVVPKESAEISVAEDGTLGIKELNVNKLVQTAGMFLGRQMEG